MQLAAPCLSSDQFARFEVEILMWPFCGKITIWVLSSAELKMKFRLQTDNQSVLGNVAPVRCY